MSDVASVNAKLHVAIIMDGNGRWASARGLPRTMGHRAGIEAVKRTLKACKNLPVGYLTLYSFSAENWRRPVAEISELMQLLRLYLGSELATFHKEGICIRVIGDRSKLPPDIVKMIEQAEETTKDNQALVLTLALSYGGRQEITEAIRGIASEIQQGKIKPEEINEDLVQSFLSTKNLPDPDLIIRTSGEKRISNFLLWQSAYAEYVFPEVLWPDFGEQNLVEALEEFRHRDRRYGATGEPN